MSAGAPPRSHPYQGLVPFEEQDAPFFFGRDRETSQILSHVIASRLTLLYGPSGVGKSSVLNAGVAHRLRAMAAADLDDGIPPAHAVVSFGTWSGDPEPALIEASRRALEDVADRPLPEPDGPGLASALRAWTGPDGFEGSLVLLLDQFEELFVYHNGDPEAGGLGAELVALLAPAGGAPRVHVLLAFREDALAQLDVFKPHLPGLFDTVLRIDPLTAEAAAAAVTGPVERVNETAETPVTVEPALVEAVLHDVEAGRIALASEGQGGVEATPSAGRIELPFLQLVLTRLWERERALGSDTLRLATYADDLGGAEAVIRSHLDGALAALTPAQRDIAADVFRYLVTPSGTKYAIGSGDLARFAGRPETAVQAVLDALAQSDRRVLRRIPPPPPGGEASFEVAHDRLGAAVLEWRARHVAELDAKRASAEQRARAKRWALTLAGVFAVAFAAMGWWAVEQRRSAVAADAEHRKQQREARRIETERGRLASLVEAVKQAGVVTSPDERYIVIGGGDSLRVFDADSSDFLDDPIYFPSRISAATFDGREARIAFSAGADELQVRSFPCLDSLVILLATPDSERAHPHDITSLAFSPSGDTLATGSSDGVVHLWDVSGPTADGPQRPVDSKRYSRPLGSLAWGSVCGGASSPCVRRGDDPPRATCEWVVYVLSKRRLEGLTDHLHALVASGLRSHLIVDQSELNSEFPFRLALGPYCTRARAEQAKRAVSTAGADSLRTEWRDAYVRNMGDRRFLASDQCAAWTYGEDWVFDETRQGTQVLRCHRLDSPRTP